MKLELSKTNRQNIEDIYPLSPMQEGMLFESLYAPDSGVYFEQITCILTGNLDVKTFQQAWQQVVARHPVFRTAFLWESLSQPVQVVYRQINVTVETYDWRELSALEQQQQLETFLDSERQQGFQVSQAPLMRLHLIQLDENTYQFVWCHHHLLLDGWSSPLVFQDLLEFYQAISQGKSLSNIGTVSYRNYIAWLQQQDRDLANKFWRQKLQGFTTPTPLTVDKPLSVEQHSGYGEQQIDLTVSATTAVMSFVRQHQLTMSNLVQATWGLLLSRYSQETDVVFGATVSGRPPELVGVESIVGLFINTLPVRVQISEQTELLGLLKDLQAQQIESEQFSYSSLAEIQGLSDVPKGTSLFESIVVFENYPVDTAVLQGNSNFSLSNFRWIEQTTYPLAVLVSPGEQLSLRVMYDASRFEDGTISRMLGHFVTMLEAMSDDKPLCVYPTNPQQQISQLPILTKSEQQQLLVDWNDTQSNYPQDKSIHQLFEEQVELTPDAVAVVYENQHLTYRELNSRANQLAHYLKSLGVKADVLVGICVERSLEMIVGLLGILKAGGAYVPLNPEYPQERLTFMLEDTQLSVVLTQEKLVHKLGDRFQRDFADRQANVICLDSNWDIINQQTQQNPTTSVNADNLAYVMYTSGSTGQPKGVSIIHRSVVRLVKETNYISISIDDVIAQASNHAFDAATFEIWGALLNGARLVGVSKDVALSPRNFADFMRSQSISVLFLTTALFNQIAQEVPSAFNSLRYLLFGGEAVDPKWVKEVLNNGAPQQLLHVYGPTENTTFSSWYLVQDVPKGATTIPIGQPISNTQIYLLDPQLQPVGIGVPGELYVGGDGLAREYLNRTELTQEKFIPNPFSGSRGAEEQGSKGAGERRRKIAQFPVPNTQSPVPSPRLYKTGDLARYLPDGNIEYLSRIDDQVKIRGLRIELGEIEAVLSQHSDVQISCVIVREDTPGDKRLVAYVVTHHDCQPTMGEIRQFLKAKLPDYMIPSAFVILESLPLNLNGKVDRRALPKPDLDTALLEKYFAPRTPIEEMLALLWAQVLKVDLVGIHDNFFELGGHSLLATQLVSRIRTSFKLELPLRSLFAAPTIAELAPFIQQLQQQDIELAAPPILRRANNAELPLSYAQQRLWFLDQFEPNSSFYNIPVGLRLVGTVNVDALQQSLIEIIHRHEALRTNFVTVDGQAAQIIQAQPNWSVAVVDLQHLPFTEQKTAAQKLLQQQAIEPFDLAHDALIRATLIVLSPTEQWLLVCMHHIVSDGWSMSVFVEELTAIYNAYSQGQPSSLLPLPIQYADFAIWQRQWLVGEVLNSQLGYWKQQLANAPTFLPLPTDRPRPAVQTFNGAHLEFTLSVELTQKLVKLSQQQGVTLFMTLLAAYDTLLYRYTGQTDILVGSPIANRDRTDIEGLIGFFVNTLVMRTNLAENPSFNELLPQIREMALSAYAHQDLPFEMLVEALQPERDLSHTPLFQVMFVLNNAPTSEVELTGLTVSELPIESAIAKFDLTLSVENTSTGLVGGWDYNTDLFDSSTIERMTGHFLILLEAIVANPSERISQLPILTAFEQQQLLVEWNDTQVDYPQDKCIHQLFEEQVERTPDAVAVVFENQQLTYHELNTRANQLAHYLRSLGVGADVLVGICVERSLEMVVGLLGVLKAGGAYVPIDPEYPQDRLSFMLENAQVSVLLTQQHLVEKLPEHQARVVCLDTDWEIIPQSNQQNPITGVQTSNLAYVIYTSGSTGKPKGAINTHLGICNRLLWMQQAYQLTEIDCVLQKTPFSFDVSVWEFFWPLLTGARLVVAKPGGHKDSGYLVNLILEQQVTTLHFVPSMLRAFLEEESVKNCSSLKRVICSGEALPKELQERFFACLGCQLHNLYGPTEAAIDVTFWECQPESNLKTVPIGRPISNTQIYILDQNLQPVPVGVPGELHIGGVGLAKGYLNAKELTQEKFIPNPFSGSRGAGEQRSRGVRERRKKIAQSLVPSPRLYKTGDLARYLPDGNIEYLGRIDNQVKLRGFRIELGEIEAALTQHQGVGETVVIAREDDPGNKRLVAYIVPHQENAFPVLQLLRLKNKGLLHEELLYELPNGMVIAHLNKNETEFVYKELWEELAYLKHGITINEGDCIFDVGANIGLFALFAGQRCKDVPIYAFEPIPPVFDILRINTEGYGLNIKLFNLGLSSETKSDIFTYYPQVSLISGRFADTAQERELLKSFLFKQQNIGENNTGVSSQAIDELLAEKLQSQQFTCHLRTISDVISEYGIERIDLLKIDVEKSERDVLSGIQQKDWQKIQQIVVEVHNINGRLEEIATLLKEHGYDLTIEQDALLENTGLYNIYARRPSKNQYLPEKSGSSLVSDCVKPTWGNSSLLVSDVRSFIQKKLPEYMMPNAFVVLESLPLTPNGKVDRRALPAPEASSELLAKYVAPRTSIEELLVQIWAQVLKVEQVGIYGNFFELGGHSLLATQLVSRIRTSLKVELPLRSLFAAPTIAQLALLIQQLQQQDLELAAPPILRRTENANLPLSYSQQRLWFLDQFESNSSFYNIPVGLRLVGTVNVDALQQSLIEIIHRHEALRTNFVTADGQAAQIIQTQPNWSVTVVDLQHLPVTEQKTAAQKLLQQEAIEPFDLAHDALIRATLIVLSPTEQWLLVCMHHIVSDGWSIGVFVEELQALYNAYSQGQPSSLLPLPIQYADFAIWQRQWLQGEVLNSQLGYWKQQLANAPTFLPLPTDRPRPAVQTFNGAYLEFALSAELTQQLTKLSQQQGVTLFMTLLAAYNTLLYRYTGQEDILVGSPIANRDRTETERLIGFFVNTLVMRTNLTENPSFSELLSRVRNVAMEAYAHQNLPFEMLVEALQPERDLSHTPLFQVMFVLQNAPTASGLDLTGLNVSSLPVKLTTSRFDLTLIMQNSPTGLIGLWEYSTDLFDASTIDRMTSHFVTLLEGIAANPEQQISQLPLLTQPEQQKLLVEWNDTQVDYPLHKCIHQLFEEQVELTPNAVAVEFENQQLTYNQLNCRANQLAHHLRSLGVGADILVGLCVERSLEMVIGLLGILKAGGAYLPLDPEYPPERLSFILEDTQVKILLTQQRLIDRLPQCEEAGGQGAGSRGEKPPTKDGASTKGKEGALSFSASYEAKLVCLDTDAQEISKCSQDNIISGVQSNNLTYIIYTSGSTGKPKGIAMSQLALCNHILWHRDNLKIVRGAKTLQFASINFDVSFQEIFTTWCSGGTLFLITEELRHDTGALLGFLQEKAIQRMFLPVVGLQQLAEVAVSSELVNTHLREIITSGDQLRITPAIYEWLGKLSDCTLHNQYGPSESHLATSFTLPYTVETWPLLPPIGRPISNTQIYILGKYLQPVPVGVTGEVYIAGVLLAQGYFNRPQLTQQKFIPNPFVRSRGAGEQGSKGAETQSPVPSPRLYKTGDLARYLPDGNIESLGRIDNQVKIRGFRIELGEVEAILGQLSDVQASCAVVREDTPGDKRLVAYIVPQPEQRVSVNVVRSFLKSKLPEYMVPSAIVILDALPLTPNGKLDRRALPTPDLQSQLSDKYVAPRNPIEEILSLIWAQVLKVELVGIHDNFFELGGHSLLATQLVSRVRTNLKVELSLRSLFAAPTIAQLSQNIQQLQQQDLEIVAPPILKRTENAEIPLSYAQQRLWFLDKLNPNSASYNIPVGLRLVGTINVVALEQSFREIIHRHEALRTNFVVVDGKPLQIIQIQTNWTITVVDLQHLPVTEQKTAAQKLLQQQAIEPFDLAHDALIRATLIVLSPTEQWLLVCMHHIVSDGWSMSVFVEELTAIYNAYSQGQPSSLLPLPIQYADFAIWQRQWLVGEVLNSQLSYWKQQLANAPTFLPLATDRPRPAVQTFNGAHLEFTLSVELTQKLVKLSQQQGVTLFMTLLAAYNTLLYRYTGQTDILVGTPIANRDRTDIEGLIGFFVNTLVMRTNLAENPSFSELLPQIREMALSAYAHQDLPFEMLVEALQAERDMSHTPLFQVMFVLQNTPVSQLELTRLSVSELPIETSTTKFDLTLVMENTGTGLVGWWQYNTDLFDSSTIERMMDHFACLLEGIVANPSERISQLPMLTAFEQQQLLVEWNDTQVDYAFDKCIHQLFEEQVQRTPDAVAVVFVDKRSEASGRVNEQLTYHQLNCRANQLADYLQSLGVSADVLVGLCVERSLLMVIGLLAILKAGGAYVPLDPEYPSDRLGFMLEDTQVPVLLTQQHLLSKLPPNQAKLVFLDEIWLEIGQNNQDNVTSKVTASGLANVIYTSGSTGKPKGVMVEHQGLVNLAQAQIQTFGVHSDSRVLQFASLSFDACIWEVIMALRTGATLYLGKKDSIMPGMPLMERLRDYGITHVTLPPSALAVLPTEELPKLQTIIVAGEACPAELIKFWSAGRNFFNAYGPTEASVCATVAKCTPEDEKITIGRPIANTQVYILDENLQLVPVGVAGELHIGGAGLARGYLNRPELTQEKFIPNPFVRSRGAGEQGSRGAETQYPVPSPRLYKTGDLASYLPDGNIEYLGRIDNQLKIRGFRIELGEIEAILSQHPGVRENVVVAREDIPGEKRLVAYFVPQLEQTPTTNELRIFLTEKLPQYMLPSAFVRLEFLPLTPNGKVDRKALPVPDSNNTQLAVSFVAPRTPVEKILADIWANALHIEKVGVLDNFFELGGHSLTTIQVMSQINETFQMKLPLRHLFTAPTIAELAYTIESTSEADSSINANEITNVNLQAEVVLDETIKPGNLVYQPVSEPKAILLTGATGFVGAFLLAELLQQTQADIYCLVRAADFTAGKQRLQETLKAYLVWEESFNSRIIPVLGDLSQPLLGLSDEQFHLMAEKIDSIYHNGALVNHVYPYALFKAANVRATEEVLRLASQIKIKPVHFISTLSVFSSDEYFKLEVVQENDPLEHGQGLVGGYTQSKWVAEKIVMMARDRGLPCSIYRLGRITWHSQTGVWNSNDILYRFIKSCIQLKSAPEMNSMVEITPVDYLAKALIHLSQQPESLSKAFHLISSHSAPWSQLINSIRSLGYPLQQLSYEDWQAELVRNTQISTDNALYSAISLAEDNTSSESKENAAPSLKFDCQNTLNGLADTSIGWPEVDDKLLQVFFTNFSNSTLDKKR